MNTNRLSSLLLVVVTTIAALPSTPRSARALPWVFEDIRVTSPPIRAISLDVDEPGDPHIAFAQRGAGGGNLCGNYLKYATRTGGTWTAQVGDSIGLQMWSEYSAIATDVDWFPHIAYTHMTVNCVGTPQEIRYARNTGSAWIVEVVDSTSSAFVADLETDPDEDVHVVYRGSSANYAVRSTGNWTIEDIPNVNGGHAALALHGNGTEVHAAFSTGGVAATWYAARQAGTWTVESLGRISDRCDIAVDNGGQPHIAWSRRDVAADTDSVLYATKTGGSWVIETVEVNAGNVHINVDENGNPHLAYQGLGGSPDRVISARRWGGVWQSEIVDADSIVARWIGFDLDALGRPHLAYLVDSGVRYATLDPATSVSPTIGEDPIHLTVAPNPSRVGDARILYQAPLDTPFDLDIYDPSGRKVRRLAAGALARSSGSAAWDGRDDAGQLDSAGTYLVRLTLGSQDSRSAKVVLLR